MTYHLSLGSNLGNPARNLARAVRLLQAGGVDVVKASSVYRTEPVDETAQPWFHNQVVEVETGLDPQALLWLAKGIEGEMGRTPSAEKGPRPIDIDILLAGEVVIETPVLTVPHPRLARRNFVLVPLLEIAPDVVHPLLKKTVRDMARGCPDAAAVIKLEK
jgi:2-amino-4-hydroxy-6-hydroxymethyldihydropteridine diphosphokinase